MQYVYLSCPAMMSTVSTAYLQSNQVMGWGEKAIELRSANTGNLEGVFMHKKAQKLKFLCERNDKVRLFSCDRPLQAHAVNLMGPNNI